MTVGDGEIGRFGKGSKVQNVEKEDGKEWEPREWDREEWQKQWLEKDNYGSRSDGEGGEKVAPLLPFNEGESRARVCSAKRTDKAEISPCQNSTPCDRNRRRHETDSLPREDSVEEGEQAWESHGAVS